MQRLIEDYAPTLLVVGLPLNMDGTESDMSTLAREFGDRLTRRFGLPHAMQDERLTSRSAQPDVSGTGDGTTVHELAACLIAEDWLRQYAT